MATSGVVVREHPAEQPVPVPASVPAPVPAPKGARTLLRAPLTFGAWTVIGFCFGMITAIAVLDLSGYRSLVVVSGSMEPVIHPGDLVIDRPIAPIQARIGDILTFRDPSNPRRLITHRVRSLRVTGPFVAVVTKGDNSNAVQRWRIDAHGRVGRVVARVPWIGYPISWIRTRVGLIALLIVPSLLLGVHVLARIWRPSPPEPLVEVGS